MPRVKECRKLSRSCNRGGPSYSCCTTIECLIPLLVVSSSAAVTGKRLERIQLRFGCCGPLMVVDVLPSDGTSSLISNSRRYPCRLFGFRPLASLGAEMRGGAYDGPAARPSRQRKLCRRGRRVARLLAVMPIPGSTVLQMATSVVAPNLTVSNQIFRAGFWGRTCTRSLARWLRNECTASSRPLRCFHYIMSTFHSK